MKKRIPLGIFIASIIFALVLGAVCTGCVTAMKMRLKNEEALRQVQQKASAEHDKLDEVLDIFGKKAIVERDSDEDIESLVQYYVSITDDRWAHYYTAEEWEREEASRQGESQGVGLLIEFRENDAGAQSAIVEWVYDGSGAHKAGMLPGDVIVSVNGKAIAGMTSDEVTGAIHGESKTFVTIGVMRGDEEKEFSVERGEYTLQTVFAKMLSDGKTGLIHISSFNATTADEFKKAIDALKKSGVSRLVFDLRDNPGGLVDAVAEVLDTLLPEGNIYTLRDKNDKVVEKRDSDKNEINMPMAILTSGRTASASELFCAAMRDYRRATIVGEKTYGKGVAQSIFRLSDKSALKLTTYKFYSPLGINYNGVGIEPDVEVAVGSEVNCYMINENDDVQLQRALVILRGQSGGEQ